MSKEKYILFHSFWICSLKFGESLSVLGTSFGELAHLESTEDSGLRALSDGVMSDLLVLSSQYISLRPVMLDLFKVGDLPLVKAVSHRLPRIHPIFFRQLFDIYKLA